MQYEWFVAEFQLAVLPFGWPNFYLFGGKSTNKS